MKQSKIILFEGDKENIDSVLFVLEHYLFRKKINFLILDLPIALNQYGAMAIHAKNATDRFLLTYLSFKGHYFDPKYFYFIKGSFFQYFLKSRQTIYTYLSLQNYLPRYLTVVISEERESYMVINKMLNTPILYLHPSEEAINNVFKILFANSAS